MDDLAALIDLNRDYITSVQTSDVRRFDEILADDFLCSNPDGSLVDRAGFLKQTAVPANVANVLAPVVVGDRLEAEATVEQTDGKKRSVKVTVRRAGAAVMEGEFLAVVPDGHILDVARSRPRA